MLRLWGEGRFIFVFILNLTFFFFPQCICSCSVQTGEPMKKLHKRPEKTEVKFLLPIPPPHTHLMSIVSSRAD